MIKFIRENLEKTLLLGIKVVVFLILLTPIVLSPMNIFPTVFTKAIYFRILVEILFFLYILLLFHDKKQLPKISPIFISVLIFIEILFFSTLKSINPWRSFWGTMERMEGFLTLLHFFIFFLILVSIFKSKKDWLNLLRSIVFLSIPIGIAGIIQKLGIFNFYAIDDSRISATFGNPVFYGSYLVLIMFLAIFLGIFETNKKLKILFWIIAIFNFIFLLLTGSRGAWIGMISGLSVFLIWLLFYPKFREKRKILLFGIFIVSFFFLLFLLFSSFGYLPKTYFFERYENLFEDLLLFQDARLDILKLGFDAWKSNPFFGFGLESFSYIYDVNYKSSFIKNIPEDEFYDRAHNKIIDTLVSTGILGLISYFAIFISTVSIILKYREKFSPMLSSILISLLLAYFVQNIFAFDTISSYLIFFLILGFIDVNFKKEEDLVKENKIQEKLAPPPFLNQKLLFYIKTVATIFLFLSLVSTIFFVNIRPLLVSFRLAEGRRLLNNGEAEKAIKLFNQSFLPKSFCTFEAHYYSAALLFNALPLPQNQKWQAEIYQELEKIAKPLEDDLEEKIEIKKMSAYLLLAQIYKNLYFFKRDTKFLEYEERILGKALGLNSETPKVYRLAGKMRFLQKREEEGMVFFTKAFELDKDYVVTNEWIGESLIEAGEKKRGATTLRKAMKIGNFYTKEKFNLNIIWKLADLYEELGDFQELSKFYEETIKRYPKELPINPQLFASLATVYAKIGEKDKARQTIERMTKLYPYLRLSAEEFLSNLDKIQ